MRTARTHPAPVSRRCGRDDRGIVLLLFALTLTFLLVLVAMAVDLGQVRSSRRQVQSASDLAALDAGRYLSGRSSAAVDSLPVQACIAATESVARNLADFALPPLATIAAQCGGFPITGSACIPSTTHTATFSSGPYVLTIHYPVRAADLTAIAGGPGALDGTNACERLRVSLRKADRTTFAQVIGVDELTTQVQAVVRSGPEDPGGEVAPPAFLLLERTDCGVLGNSAGGAGNEGIVVEANGVLPGVIHVDSNATTNCSGTTQSAYAIYGSPLSSGQPSIKAHAGATQPDGSPGRSGIIESLATNGKGGATFPGGLSTAPTTASQIVSRRPIDARYNGSASPAITDLHAAASAAVRSTGTPVGFATMGCNDPVPVATKVFVNCASFNATRVFLGVTHVTFSGEVSLKMSNVASFPTATDIVVRGRLDIPQGRLSAPVVTRFYVGGGVAVSNGSGLAVNAPNEFGCVGRTAPAWTNTARLAIFGGDPALDLAGSAAFCQTTVYLGGPSSLAAYTVQQTTSGGTCSTTLPCAKDSGNVATGARFAVSGTVKWTAPNQYTATTPPTQGLEDLGYWTEGAGLSEVRSGGTLETSGVFVAPNGRLEMRSPATGSPRDAQFVARSLFLFQGTLRMRPSPNDSFNLRIPGAVVLIR